MATTPHIHLLGGLRLLFNGTLATGVNTARLPPILAFLVLHRDAPSLVPTW
jgi:hypothetical protein